jgi:hypothetical protein
MFEPICKPRKYSSQTSFVVKSAQLHEDMDKICHIALADIPLIDSI